MATPKPEINLSELVDKLGEIEERLRPYRADFHRAEELRREIRTGLDDNPPDVDLAVIEGQTFNAIVGRPGNVSVINIPKLLKAMGVKAFAAIATTTLKAISARSDGPRLLEQCVTKEQTGTRPLETFRRAA